MRFRAVSSSVLLWPAALVHSPQLIIADEPTGNIDPKLSVEMMELLKAINSVGITVVVVTHEVALAKRFGKRIITPGPWRCGKRYRPRPHGG